MKQGKKKALGKLTATCIEFSSHPGVRGIVVPITMIEHLRIDGDYFVIQLKKEEEYREALKHTPSASLSVYRTRRGIANWCAYCYYTVRLWIARILNRIRSRFR